VSHGIHGPCVLNDEEGYPRPLAGIHEIYAATYECQSVDDKKANIKNLFVAGRLLVVGNIEKEFFYTHSGTNYTTIKASFFARGQLFISASRLSARDLVGHFSLYTIFTAPRERV
jgi:hypothetical protein